MTAHRIASIHFLPRTNLAPGMSCTCGAAFDFHPGNGSHGSDSWSMHRKAVGVRIAHINQAVATDVSPSFIARRPGHTDRGHEPDWREHGDGRRTCRSCQRDQERQRRAAERQEVGV